MFTQSNFKLLGAIQESLRQDALRELADTAAWGHHTIRQDFPDSAHKDTRSIILRGPRVLDLSSQETLDAEDYDYAFPDIQACLLHALDLVPFRELGRVFVVSLRAGGHIAPHRDEGAYAEHYSRMHVSLQSAAGNSFQCGRDLVHMAPGEVWTFNHRDTHQVWNNSDAERIHIIIDYKE